jgi:hypothetical protein
MNQKLDTLNGALIIAKEAMQYVKEQKTSRANWVLYAEDGDFAGALEAYPDLRPALMQLRDQIVGNILPVEILPDPYEVLEYIKTGSFKIEIFDNYFKATDPASKTEYKITNNLFFSYINGVTGGSLVIPVDLRLDSPHKEDAPLKIFKRLREDSEFKEFSEDEIMSIAIEWAKDPKLGVYHTYKTVALRGQSLHEQKFGFKTNQDYRAGMKDWEIHGQRFFIGKQYEQKGLGVDALCDNLLDHDAEGNPIEYDY